MRKTPNPKHQTPNKLQIPKRGLGSMSPAAAQAIREGGELRQDLVTGKWAIIAKGRARRPSDYSEKRGKPPVLVKYQNNCPFCNLVEYPQSPDVLRLPDDNDAWQVHIFENKYPALKPSQDFKAWQNGLYRAVQAVGYHELLATRWHNQEEHTQPAREVALTLEALVLRYRNLKTKPFVNYIHIIRNHGAEAGASLEHPHYQIFTLPVVPSDIMDMLLGAKQYYDVHGRNAFDAVLEQERESGERVVWENELFTAFCPFASRVPFEVTIMPRRQQNSFDEMSPDEREALAEALRQVWRRLYEGLSDPPCNLVVQSAPCDESGKIVDPSLMKHFRWHITFYPRLSTWGGFEMGTGLEITDAVPEESASFLRELDINN